MYTFTKANVSMGTGGEPTYKKIKIKFYHMFTPLVFFYEYMAIRTRFSIR